MQNYSKNDISWIICSSIEINNKQSNRMFFIIHRNCEHRTASWKKFTFPSNLSFQFIPKILHSHARTFKPSSYPLLPLFFLPFCKYFLFSIPPCIGIYIYPHLTRAFYILIFPSFSFQSSSLSSKKKLLRFIYSVL